MDHFGGRAIDSPRSLFKVFGPNRFWLAVPIKLTSLHWSLLCVRRVRWSALRLSGGDWKIQSVEFGFDGSWLLRFDSFEGAQKERETRLALWAG